MLRRLALALTLAAAPAAAQDDPTVAVVNYPLAYFAERLGGDGVEVLFPVPPDRDPAYWRPSLAEITAIQGADLIALNGAGFAQWVTKVSLPRARSVDTSAAFADAFIPTETVTHSHGAEGEHSHTGTASFTWLDFAQARMQAEALAAAMARAMPDLAARIEAEAAALGADLDALDARATEVAAGLAGRPLLATHPRYQYFARAYGLDIRAMAWEAGAMPSQADWTELERLATETGARVLIWEATPVDEARRGAAEIGLRSVVVPTLANRPADGDFLVAMQGALDALAAPDIGN